MGKKFVTAFLLIGILLTPILATYITARVDHAWDAKYFWVPSAIAFYQEGITFTRLAKMESHPCFVPVMIVVIFWLGNGPMFLLSKIPFILFYSGLLFLFYFNLCKELSFNRSLFWTFLLTGFPLIFYHSTTAYADLPLSLFYLGAMIYGSRCSKHRSKDVLISGIFFGLAVNTKFLGSVFWVIAFMYYFFFALKSKRLKDSTINTLLLGLQPYFRSVPVVQPLAIGKTVLQKGREVL